jgi:purine-nucleoside phosphorylase
MHLEAKPGDIAELVLMPGDPLRAKHIAEKYFENPQCYNTVRNMLGYTGTYNGKRVSVQAHGIGSPTMTVYAYELVKFYGVKKIVRVGTCGAYQPHVRVRDLILAMSASWDSSIPRFRFGSVSYAPTANFELLLKAYNLATREKIPVHVGSVYTTDLFYHSDDGMDDLFTKFGALAVEMETAALYTVAAEFGVKALSILTVSDHLATGEETSPAERQSTFDQMIEMALDTVAED